MNLGMAQPSCLGTDAVEGRYSDDVRVSAQLRTWFENELRHIVRRAQESHQWPRRIELGYEPSSDRIVCGLTMDPGPNLSFVLPREFTCERAAIACEWDANVLRALWSRLYEDERLESQIRHARERLTEALRVSLNLDPRIFEAHEREVESLRRGHQGAYNGYAQQAVGLLNYRNAFLMGMDWGTTGEDTAVAQRGEDLLRSNLSPAQLTQYDTGKSFEVVGSHSDKTYRIRHGRQMNIDELSGPSGTKVMGWCFLPQGGLCAGDCMLGQKIALETDERAALAVANKFPVHGMTVRDYREGMHGLWPAQMIHDEVRIGSTLRIRLPNDYQVRQSADLTEPVEIDSAAWTGGSQW